MNEKNFTKHFIVKGLVQGVWYRASTQKKAKEIGVTGWVKNLPDGAVEVLACGTPEQLEYLEQWLWHGPDAAEVKAVEVKECIWEQHDSFEKRV